MRIETLRAAMSVHVIASGDAIELGIGDPADSGSLVARLSLPQAAMVLHALGSEIAQVEERQRREVEQQTRIAEVVADTEIRRR